MTIRVQKPGMFTTVQDLGRYGYQQYGVPVAGAMDGFALRAANLLVGNQEGEAGLEITLLGPTLEFGAEHVLAITGADVDVTLDGRPVGLWESFRVRPGAVLKFGRPRTGVRAYLAVAGGLDVPVVIGSRSTYVRGRLGGFQGRPLQAGDELPIGPNRHPTPGRRLPPQTVPGAIHTARVMLGPQDDHFPPESLQTFLSSSYRVSTVSDRMGYRLEGPKLRHSKGPDIISDAIAAGAVQVPGHGTPIIMLADRQTTGGYTKIATVIAADLRVVAQQAPGEAIDFRQVTADEAVAALREQEEILGLLRGAGAVAVGASSNSALLRPTPGFEMVAGLLEELGQSKSTQVVYSRPGLRLEVRR